MNNPNQKSKSKTERNKKRKHLLSRVLLIILLLLLLIPSLSGRTTGDTLEEESPDQDGNTTRSPQKSQEAPESTLARKDVKIIIHTFPATEPIQEPEEAIASSEPEPEDWDTDEWNNTYETEPDYEEECMDVTQPTVGSDIVESLKEPPFDIGVPKELSKRDVVIMICLLLLGFGKVLQPV